MTDKQNVRKAVLVMAVAADERNDFEDMKEEMIELCAANTIDIQSVLVQNIVKPHKATYIGAGKIEELMLLIDETVDLIVFNVGLSPSQLRNIEKCVACSVIDKNKLILSIFSDRAQTVESKARVEIANLRYMLPRMKGSYEALGRQGGGKNRGLGETKLELDQRHVQKRIRALNNIIEKTEINRKNQRMQKMKSNMPLVVLVGYTNSGKSTLMNKLLNHEVDKHVFAKDMLFASLETVSRRIVLDQNHAIILHDTVGFIRKLPKSLLNAFHGTIEEIKDADVILHVVDQSNPRSDEYQDVINETLSSLQMGDKPTIIVYNKCDLVEDKKGNNIDSVSVSALTGVGVDQLKHMILSHVTTKVSI